MKKLVSVLLLTFVLLTVKAQKQNDPTLLTVGGEKVSLSEFESIYNKNNTTDKVSKESINEYLDLYIKFKLKVREAEALGYDTTAAFVKELAGYRKQLAQPYLSDKKVTESLIKEAYKRMQTDVKASHILIAISLDADPKDTLIAYNKIMKIRRRILQGEDFAKVAKEVSDDPSAKKNGGNLGYFSTFNMVYPFETAAYNTKVGEISMPVRTSFGYHILKITDKRPSRGTIKVAHIMVRAERNSKGVNFAEKKKKIDEIYDKLINEKADFAALAKQYSDDKGSAIRGGELPPFGAGKMVEEFETAAFALKKDGDISKPIQTDYGYHIIKRLSLQKLGSYDDLYSTIKAKVARDSRSNKSKNVVVDKIKKDNNFKEHLNERNDFYKVVNANEFFNGKWTANKAKKLNKVMFGFYAKDGDKLEYTQTDFAKALQKSAKRRHKKTPVKAVINNLYKKVVEATALKFKDSRLPKTNQEFRLLMQEYRDGILLFNLTDKKVWSKAIKDSVGLNSFYKKNKSNYMWGKRVKATIYTCNSEKIANKVAKIIKKKTKKGYTNNDILKMINTDSQLNLSIEEGTFAKGDNKDVDKAIWNADNSSWLEKGATSSFQKGKNIIIVEVIDILAPSPKPLKNIRGLVTSDYQNYLEKEWVKALKTKYKVVVNKDVLKLVK